MKSKPPSRVELLRGTLDLLILRTLLPGPSHGHAIARHIQRTSEELLQVETGSSTGTPPAGGERLDRRLLGVVRQGQARTVLPPHRVGTETARQRTLEVAGVLARHGTAANAVEEDGQ